MFEFGTFSEILIIVIAAVILLGPKELPRALYQLGRWLQRIKHFSHQLRQGLDGYIEEGAFDEYVKIHNNKYPRFEKNRKIKARPQAKLQKKSRARKANYD